GHFFFFFFFQAEDGIRDKLVTGVQTCALPISWLRHLATRTTCHRSASVKRSKNVRRRATANFSASESSEPPSRASRSVIAEAKRSEERRVGKECRCRWARYH